MDPHLRSAITSNSEYESIREVVEERGEIDLNCAGEIASFMPLHYAVEQWNTKAIEELLALGADINVKSNEAQTALQFAIREINYDVKDVQLDTIKLLVEKGIEVPEDILLSPLIDKPKIVWVLIRNVKNTVLKLYDPSCMEYPGEYDPLEHFLQDVTETEIDIVTHYLNHPEFELNNPTSSRKYSYAHPGYKNAMEAFMALEQFENAMKVVVLLHNGIGHSATWNSQGSDQATDITFSKIFDNMTDFSYVDRKGTTLVDMIFGTYIREICKLETRMGRKLLELGADRNIMMEAFVKCIRKIDYSIGSYSKTLEKLVDTGIDLAGTHTYTDECSEEIITIDLKDQVYLAAAEFGTPKVLAEAIEKGANILQHFDSADQRTSIEFIINPKDELTKEREEQKYEECLEIIMKEIIKKENLLNLKIVTQKGSMQEYFEKVLDGYNKKLEKDGRLLVDYLKEKGKLQVLSNIGFLPASPTNLSIVMGTLSCELNWEFENQIEYPVTGFRIQVMEASEAEDLQTNLNQVLANHSTIGILWEQIGFKKQLDQALTEIYKEFDWEEMKTKQWKNTWLEGAFKEFPELEREVDKVLRAKTKGNWKTVCNLVGEDQTRISVSTLKYGSRVKFCVFAENQNGFSLPNIGTEYHKVLAGKPDSPGKPDVETMDGNLFIVWVESDTAKLTGVKMYRVEGETKSEQWKVLGEIYAGFDSKLCFFNYNKHGITCVRVIAVNDEEESEPSETSIIY